MEHISQYLQRLCLCIILIYGGILIESNLKIAVREQALPDVKTWSHGQAAAQDDGEGPPAVASPMSWKKLQSLWEREEAVQNLVSPSPGDIACHKHRITS